ncbi:MAG: hypothetical protein WCH34_02500 [Bacteroidota bacterium]
MARKDFFPKQLLELKEWALLYKLNIGIYGSALGLTALEISAQQALCDLIITKIEAALAAKAEAEMKNEEKMTAIENVIDTLRPKIKGYKTTSGYTEAIGKALGVVGEEIIIDFNTVKTEVLLTKIELGIDIKFTLEHCKGGYIYCKRGSETEFTFLKYVTHPHTVDTRPNLGNVASEQRQYYVVLIFNDKEVGVRSDIATISN